MQPRLALIAFVGLAGFTQAAEPLPQRPSGDQSLGMFVAGDDFWATPDDQSSDFRLQDEFVPVSGSDWAPVSCLQRDNDLCCDSDLCCGGSLGCDSCGGCDGCLAGCCNDCCSTKFYVGLDFAVLKPEVETLRVPGSQVAITPDHEYEIAPRLFAGFETCNGFGGQISYWTLETGRDTPTSIRQIINELDMQAADVDITKSVTVGGWSVQAGAGGRWAQVENGYYLATNASQRFRTQFEGSGPTAVLNIRRPLGCGSWALVGEGRASFLYGDTDIDTPIAPNLSVGDDWVEVWEGRAGIEWTGTTANGCALFFVRGMIEAQVWKMPSIGPLGSQDLEFLGPTVSSGFVF